ncbi:hypothetical protein [Microbacterium sp. C7(2022)]|uniref:hypothetical protein n=1 Tax=Microbacterium sp. C7(2022) TaxID=2992759 RepID=UPI00237B8D8B|nr:hypothetical protein [Microbacterium sp. C7(2022)]MDE0546398.1 hypothetical protein [Microbacterium sp. C7(2022)]
MDSGVVKDPAADALAPAAPAESPRSDATSAGPQGAASGTPTSPPASGRRAKRRLAVDLSILAVIGVLLIAAVAAAFGAVQRELYSPTAFVERYLSLLADGNAAEALTVPGVSVASTDLESADLPPTAHDALLRSSAMGSLSDAHVISEVLHGDVYEVTVEYKAGRYEGTSTFEVIREGQVGIAPTWRFATSPLAVLTLDVRGSTTFDVNGFALDKRQVSPDGADADPADPVDLLVFTPGLYSVSVNSAIASTAGVAVLSDAPFAEVPVRVQAQPTEQFTEVVQQRVEEFLTTCATQEVLQPTGCPFGYVVEDRIVGTPKWSILAQPTIELVPNGANWSIPATDAVAGISVDIQSLFDGSITATEDEVPFRLTGTIRVLADGSVTIAVSGTDTQ